MPRKRMISTLEAFPLCYASLLSQNFIHSCHPCRLSYVDRNCCDLDGSRGASSIAECSISDDPVDDAGNNLVGLYVGLPLAIVAIVIGILGRGWYLRRRDTRIVFDGIGTGEDVEFVRIRSSQQATSRWV